MKISIVVPTHNRPKKLKRALRSIFNQSCLPFEVIVVDDGSVPAVNSDIFSNASTSLQTKLLRNDAPQGANNARNRGVREATGDWIAFLDDDDEFSPHKISKILEIFKNYGDDLDLLYHPAIIHMVNEDVSYTTTPKNFEGKGVDVLNALLVKNYIGGTSMAIVKRTKLIEVGLFDEKLKSLQDYDLWINLAIHNSNLHLIDIELTNYYQDTKRGSISKSVRRNRMSINYIENKYSAYYKELSKNELKEHELWKWDMQIHKAYLNKRYWKSLTLNLNALVDSKKLKYLLAFFISLFGSRFIFLLRSIKN